MKNIIFIITLLLFNFLHAEEARLLRFPATNGTDIIFTYGGDLYKVSIKGGEAKKITNYQSGYEMFAKFSPDGKMIAFTGQYDGNTEVYTAFSDGGEPKRMTYTATLDRDDISDRMGPNNIVMTWKDNENIIYRSRGKSFNDFKGKLYLVNIKGGLSEELPLPEGGFCSYSPDGLKLAYNRVFREFRAWKYYKGGMADDIWIYDFKTKQIENISNTVNQDICPMWIGNEIYYISDRDRTMNMFCYNISTKQTTKVTSFTEYDIKFPSYWGNFIVFENAGYIYLFDTKTKQSSKVTIEINDDKLGSRSEYKDVSKRIGSIDVSYDGKRVVVGARGDVYTVPVSSGITRNLTNTSGVHDRNVTWSPDGKWVAYISDRTGEDEIYIQTQDGKEEAIQLTTNSDTYKYAFGWSPDSKKILWSDKMQRLRYVDINTKAIVEVEHTLDGEIRSFNWSPDSKWITYTFPRYRTTNVVIVYNIDSKEKHTVTDEWFNANNPIFSNDGKYLIYSMGTKFSPYYSATEWNHAYNISRKLYFVPLTIETESPYKYTNDEVVVEESKNDKKSEDKKDSKNAKKDGVADSKNEDVKIDFTDIISRAYEVKSSGYISYAIYSDENKIYYQKPSGLYVYDMKTQKETELGGFIAQSITLDGKKMLVSSNGKYYVIDFPKSKTTLSKEIDFSGLKTEVNFREEWLQIYTECWRQMRDFFYDKNMHGNDWVKIKDKYSVLVKHVVNRNDLNYVIGEMIGELNCGHAYIGGGERDFPNRVKTGLLGAVISKDKSGYFKIEKILQGRNWDEELRSPLTENGSLIKEGDFIIAINGKDLKNINDIYIELFGKANVIIEMQTNSKSSKDGATTTVIKPIASEASLYYFNWVQNNIDIVSRETNGEVGYVHIPDMGVGGLNEFAKHFYPQLNKKALIIDDRGNGGGNVSPMIIERLRREIAMYSIARNGAPQTKPDALMTGPKVLLLDKYSASDGDLFPYQFKYYKLGKTVGKRSWGGVVGIRGTLPLIDGGSLNRPEFAHFAADGSDFIIEGHGVEPDVEIDNNPAKEYSGIDEQLLKAIEIIKEELKNNPPKEIKTPAYPNKMD